MKIYHVTSPQNAESLLLHPVFRAKACERDPTGSIGLHAYSFKYGYFRDQPAAQYGVRLILEWAGKVTHTHFHRTKELTSNCLYVQYPWRCFIPAGSDSAHLRIVGVLPDKSGELERYLNIEKTQRWGADSAYSQFAQMKVQDYVKSFWRRCEQYPTFLSVADSGQSHSIALHA